MTNKVARMSEQEELVELLNSSHLYYDTGSNYELSVEDAAAEILAAGYRKVEGGADE